MIGLRGETEEGDRLIVYTGGPIIYLDRQKSKK